MGFHMSVANVVPLPRRSHFTIIANQFLAIAVQAKLSASDMKVYLAIAQHADGNCTAWPSLKRIAELAGIANVTHVSRSIRRIEDARLLTRVRRRNRQGKWDSTTYTIAHLEPVTKSGHQSSDEIWSLDQGTSDQIWSAPVTKDGQLNRSYEHSKNSPPPLPSGEVPPATPEKKKSNARAKRLPLDWEPDPDGIAYAKGIGLSDEEISSEFEKFTDYHIGKGSLWVDWNRAWRTWCRKAVEFAERDRSYAARRPREDRTDGSGIATAIANILARRKGARDWRSADDP